MPVKLTEEKSETQLRVSGAPRIRFAVSAKKQAHYLQTVQCTQHNCFLTHMRGVWGLQTSLAIQSLVFLVVLSLSWVWGSKGHLTRCAWVLRAAGLSGGSSIPEGSESWAHPTVGQGTEGEWHSYTKV